MNDDDATQLPPHRPPDDPDATRLHVPAPPLADGDHLPVGCRLEEFEIRGQVGKGGFSIVYAAWDHDLQRTVALKEYMPTSIARRATDGSVTLRSASDRTSFDIGLDSFVKEGRTLAGFNHPALVRVYRTFRAHGTAYMVMQLVEGCTLEIVAREMTGPPTEVWLLALLDPLTRVLQEVHAQDIVHRDIAPDNVMMLKETGLPLLLDFGAARRVLGAHDQNLTAMLKPSYAPLEQYPGSGMQQGAHTDVYALAATVHRVLTGAAPPNAQARAARDTCEPLATRLAGRYSAGLLRALDRALVVDPRDRTPTIASFRAELGLDGSGATAPARPAGAAAAAPRPGRPGLALALGGGGLAVLGVAGLVWWLSGPGGDSGAAAVMPPAPPPAPAPSVPAPAPSVEIAPVLPAAPLAPGEAFAQVLAQAAPELQVTLKVEQPQLKLDVTPLRLRLQSTVAGYYHVLLHDTDGQVRLLFPNEGAVQHRIEAGQTVQLPGRVRDPVTGLEGEDKLVFTEPVGPARLLVLVAPSPLGFEALTLRMEHGLRLLAQGAEAGAMQARQPGRPVYAGDPGCRPGPGCDDRFGAATADFAVVR